MLRLGALVTGLLILAGCGGGGGGQYSGPWGQVSGKVNLGTSPCTESATVTFLSTEGGYTASGELKDGEFRLKYNGGNNIPVGSYNVGISPRLPVEPTNQDPASFFNADGSTKVVERVASKIPTKYQAPGSSGITIQVAEGNNDQISIDLDLK